MSVFKPGLFRDKVAIVTGLRLDTSSRDDIFTCSRRRHRYWQGHLRGTSVPGGQRGDRLQGREQGEDRRRGHGEAGQGRDGQVQHQEGGGRKVSNYFFEYLVWWFYLFYGFFLATSRKEKAFQSMVFIV